MINVLFGGGGVNLYSRKHLERPQLLVVVHQIIYSKTKVRELGWMTLHVLVGRLSPEIRLIRLSNCSKKISLDSCKIFIYVDKMFDRINPV